MNISEIRSKYHKNICNQLLRIRENKIKGDYPNNADGDSKISVKIAWGITKLITEKSIYGNISGQEAGNIFEQLTKDFIEETFSLLSHIRPGKWNYSTHKSISLFDQYRDLANLDSFIKKNKELSTMFGQDYLISPDIVVSREPISDKELNKRTTLLNDKDSLAKLTPLRKKKLLLCKSYFACKYFLQMDS